MHVIFVQFFEREEITVIIVNINNSFSLIYQLKKKFYFIIKSFKNQNKRKLS